MTSWLIAGLALLLGVLMGGGIVFVLKNRERALRNQIIAAFPYPRQALDATGRMIFANKAFYEFARGRDIAIPELLKAEVANDEEAVAQIDRISRKAQNGVTASLELRIPRSGELGDPPFELRASSKARASPMNSTGIGYSSHLRVMRSLSASLRSRRSPAAACR